MVRLSLFLDIAVLESYHVSEAFKLISHRDYNILENTSEQEYRLARRRIIESILATDMANHSKHLTQLKAKLENYQVVKGSNLETLMSDNLNKNYETQQIVLNMIIHSADVSNPAKPLKVYTQWVDLVFQEFFNQGDIEKCKKLPISMLCDRETTSISKSQIGFINFVVKPTFEVIVNMIPEVKFYMDNIENNCKYYEDKVKEEDLQNEKSKENK